MYADEDGNPYIATYWKDSGDIAPQYHLIYIKNGKRVTQNTRFRKTDFSLSSVRTKRIPVARLQVIIWSENKKDHVAIIFRDEERSNNISLAVSKKDAREKWEIIDVHNSNVGLVEYNLSKRAGRC